MIDIDDEEFPIDNNHPEFGSFNFTDGVGFCSLSLMNEVKRRNNLSFVPHAIQVP